MQASIELKDLAGEVLLVLLFLGAALGVAIAGKIKKDDE